MFVMNVGISSTSIIIGTVAAPGLEGLVGTAAVGTWKPPALDGSPYSPSSGSFLRFR
jgi:hypothetical protein